MGHEPGLARAVGRLRSRGLAGVARTRDEIAGLLTAAGFVESNPIETPIAVMRCVVARRQAVSSAGRDPPPFYPESGRLRR